MNHFESLDKLTQAGIDEMQSVDGVGIVVAESIMAWFADEDNAALLEKLTLLGVMPIHKAKQGELAGKSFVIAGALQSMSRDQAAKKIRTLGGTFQISVDKDTTHLVAGEKVGASKLAKTERYGVKVIDEAVFIKIVREV